MKQVFIVHRWGGSPEADWYPWLKSELEKKGFTVTVIKMPIPHTPEIKRWVETLRKTVKTPSINTYLIGHSIGCQTILRYLESLPNNTEIGGALFVAGWFKVTPASISSAKDQKIAKPWLENQPSLEKVRSHVKKMIAILSDDDPYVPLIENKQEFERLGAKVIVEHDKGHYDEDTNCHELPSGLYALLELALYSSISTLINALAEI